MPDITIERHGDRWAVRDAPGATPIFESYTLQEAESEARRRAEGGQVRVIDDERGREGVGQGDHQAGAPEPHEVREHAGPDELPREPQAGL